MFRAFAISLLLASTAQANERANVVTPLGTLVWDGETSTGGSLTTVGGKLNLVNGSGSGSSWREYKLPSTIFDSDWSIQVPVYLEPGHDGQLHLSINDRFDDVVWAQGRLDLSLQPGQIVSNWQPDRLSWSRSL